MARRNVFAFISISLCSLFGQHRIMRGIADSE
jgi:hypothetical protein